MVRSCNTPELAQASLLQRFYSSYTSSEPDDCWIWTGVIGNDGYGQISKSLAGAKFHYRAHRLSCCLEHNIDIDTLDLKILVRHSCHNKLCVNPNHLSFGTHQDNIQDRIDSNRQAKGENQGLSKLLNHQVQEIMSTPYYHGMYTYFSKKYKVSVGAIWCIHKQKTWKHLK